MVKKRAIIVRSNLLDRDIRVPKEIEALKRAGYRVTLLCWDRECQASPSPSPSPQQEDSFREIRVKVRAPWGVKVLPYLPIWGCFSFWHLLVNKWDIVHALNFDTVIPAVIAGKLKRKPVIYEILETYEDRIVLPKIVRDFFINVDKIFMRLAKVVIVADEAQSKGLGGIPNPRVTVIYDSAPDFFRKINFTSRDNEKFVVFQASVLSKMRKLNLDKLFLAIKDIDNVKLILAGYGDQVAEIKRWSQEVPDKIEFIGRIEHSETLKRSKDVDLLFELRSSSVPQHKYICGSKLLQAMMCGKPFLANRGTSAAIKVRKENCGLVVDANNIEEIKEAIVKLRDNPELCKELGINARKAYELRYSWEIMEKRLISLYQELSR